MHECSQVSSLDHLEGVGAGCVSPSSRGVVGSELGKIDSSSSENSGEGGSPFAKCSTFALATSPTIWNRCVARTVATADFHLER